MNRIVLLIALAALVALAAPAGAATTPTCVGIDDDAARLACYDAANGRPPTPASASTGKTPAPPVTPEIQAAQTAATFGLSAEQLTETPQQPDRITGQVASVVVHPQTGRWTVTLENGQVWTQRETTPEARRPKPGDAVTIRKASLDSYLLSAPNRGSSRVARVK